MGITRKIQKIPRVLKENGLFVIVFEVARKILMSVYGLYCRTWTWIKLKGNGVTFSQFTTNGIPMVEVKIGGQLIMGPGFHMNNGRYYNKIGRQQPCTFVVEKGCTLRFGHNVRISSSVFFTTTGMTFGNNVKIGGNCVFYDTDFHSLDPEERRDARLDTEKRKSAPVIVEDDVFIGAHSTILKGVTIAKGSVVGAGSVVTRSIPSFEIWGGNPAAFIKKINHHEH